MAGRILIVPDKFKGTLTAAQAAAAIARGWQKAWPDDSFDLLPMSDGGDGFGEVLSSLLAAATRSMTTCDAAHRPLRSVWWWRAETKMAIIESAKVNGLAMLAGLGFHPFQLDTFGLGKVLRAAAKTGAVETVIGVGGSATNDAGFGLARALGWKFLGASGEELLEWWRLCDLTEIRAPARPLKLPLVVAVDVRNPLLGPSGCSRVYGPQKGLRPKDFELTEKCLGRLAFLLREQHRMGDAILPGAGAAGGLGFGLTAFAGARIESGFELFARYAGLEKRIRAASLVITGEGALDEQTRMGKGVGQIAAMCDRSGIPCIGMAGWAHDSVRAANLFARVHALTDIAPLHRAKKHAGPLLERLSESAGRAWKVDSVDSKRTKTAVAG